MAEETLARLVYNERPASDHVGGTKQQLQALGIAAGVPFPGEPGANKRMIVTSDLRGFRTEVKRSSWKEGEFNAYVFFPGFPPEPYCYDTKPQASRFPGVTVAEYLWCDEYFGSAEALTAAGLVPRGHFPGWPGMRKMRVTILADGSLPPGAPTANCYRAREPGARTVTLASKAKALYSVRVRLDHIEEGKRDAARAAWQAQVSSLPRPARLTDYRGLHERRAMKEPASSTLSMMGMLHRRKLPDGWRVIEGQRPA